MSLPLSARWEYDQVRSNPSTNQPIAQLVSHSHRLRSCAQKPAEGSEEAKAMEFYKNPPDWLAM